MEAMLGTYVEKEEAQVRMVAVQYAGEVFPSTHVSSRKHDLNDLKYPQNGLRL